MAVSLAFAFWVSAWEAARPGRRNLLTRGREPVGERGSRRSGWLVQKERLVRTAACPHQVVQRNALITSSANLPLDPGFCPVSRFPSCTVKTAQLAVCSNTALALRRLSARSGPDWSAERVVYQAPHAGWKGSQLIIFCDHRLQGRTHRHKTCGRCQGDQPVRPSPPWPSADGWLSAYRIASAPGVGTASAPRRLHIETAGAQGVLTRFTALTTLRRAPVISKCTAQQNLTCRRRLGF